MANITKCPTWIEGEGRKEWKRIIKLLELERRNFTEKDLKALEGYCVSYAEWKSCSETIKEKGYSYMLKNGYEQQRVEVSIGNKAQAEYRSWMKELGFTEASRARMNKNVNQLSPGEGYSKEDKEMEELMTND
jgi:P27 family predicted phage terminase small subunit